MTGMRKRSTDPRVDQKRIKGPNDRVRELRQLRREVVKKKDSPGYSRDMQLQSIDHEIKRLTRPPARRKK